MENKGNGLWNWMALIYDQFYRRFPPYQNLHRQILQEIAKTPPDSTFILDAGCGTGILCSELARRGYPVVGIDRSPSMLKLAEQKKKAEGLTNLILLEGDLNRPLDLHEYSIKRMVFIHSLYLFDDPQRTFRNLTILLPPGGEVILCNPSRKLKRMELFAGGVSFLRKAKKESGIILFPYFLLACIGMGVLNAIIQKKKEKGVFHCLNVEEVRTFLNNSGFTVKWLERSCLAESHILVCAIKE